MRGHGQLRRLARLDAEQGNLDAALDHAITAGRRETALRMVLARTWPWVMRGRRREAAEWARAVLALVGDEAPPGHELAHSMCVLFVPGADPAQVERALEVTQRSDRPAALGAWTIAGGYEGDPAEIRARAAALAERFGAHPDPWLRAMAGLAYGLVRFEYTPGGAGGPRNTCAPRGTASPVSATAGARRSACSRSAWCSPTGARGPTPYASSNRHRPAPRRSAARRRSRRR